MPSPTFIIVKPYERNGLFTSQGLNEDVNNPSDSSLVWLQARLGFISDEQSIEVVKRFPKVHTLSIEDESSWLSRDPAL